MKGLSINSGGVRMDQNIRSSFSGLAAGDMNALDEIYNALSVQIYNYARTILKSKEASEDVTHDVFLQIVKIAARLASMKKPVAYIMVITRNRAYYHLKQNKCLSISLDEAHEADVTPVLFDVVDDALSILPANRRETAYLHYLCGFKQKEVADIMRVPLVTVKWRCKKAKQQLQEYFDSDKEEQYNDTR